VDHGAGLGVASRPRFTAGQTAPTLAARVRRLIPVAVFVAGLVAYYLIYHYQVGRAGQSPVRSDGEGYYACLPSYLLYHDASFRALIRGHLSPSRTGFRPSAFGFSLQPDGNWLDKYPVGEAILLLPFFLIGHLIARMMGVAADGYSHPELYAVGVAGLAYTAAGLGALGAVLRRWFSEWVTAATLVVATFGTGVFDYATYDSIFSHAFSFFAVCVMLLAALRWYENPHSLLRALVLGLAAGAVIAIRLTDVVLLTAVLLLGVGSRLAARQRMLLLRGQADRVAVVAAAAMAMLVPQVITWYLATHHPLVRPYPGESFDFSHPQLIGSLVSFQPHGLLPYAPVLALAFGGLAAAWRWRRDLALPVTVALLPFWFLVASWWDWSFTAGFGDRAFNDIVPILAVPLAFVFARLSRPGTRVLVGGLCLILVAVTCTQMVNHWLVLLPGSGIGPSGFFRILVSRY
jgi:small-conductance mechanosensitive channel